MDHLSLKTCVHQQATLFAPKADQGFSVSSQDVASPSAYEGLLAFHKYWGKKPVEPLAFIIERLTNRGDLVIDPFSGSGVTGFAAVGLERRYLGVDINPVAARLSRLILSPPSTQEIEKASQQLEDEVKPDIESSYVTAASQLIATHYLWEETRIREIWAVSGRKRTTLRPAQEDYELFKRYEDHQPTIRNPRFFKNSRINSDPDLTWKDLFTGRALRNLELLLRGIDSLQTEAQEALRLCVTASMGQMSKMVFAISGRGKTKGTKSEKIEVGSWVIGFWRPPLHFEINVWNCFERKIAKLKSATRRQQLRKESGSLQRLLDGGCDFLVINDDTIRTLSTLPDSCAKLILTDPPHSDRAPYLELSELWNAVLGPEVNFSDEIIVSNAKDRAKTATDYNERLKRFVKLATRKLTREGCIAIQFNARDKRSWSFLREFESGVDGSGIFFKGTFPLVYSANSVVQDNRKGALITDYVLIFGAQESHTEPLSNLPGWTTDYPPHLEESDAADI